jgi:hypothetical protein
MQAANLQFNQSLQEAGLARGDIDRSMEIINQRFGQNMAEGNFDLEVAKTGIQRDLQQAGLQQTNADQVINLAMQSFGQAMSKAGFNAQQQQAGFGQEMAGKAFTAEQQQQQYGNELQNLLTGENIFGQRFQQAGQPVSQLLSALTQTNVAPGVLGPMQMPQRGGGAAGAFGSLAGGIAGSFLGPMGAAAGSNVGGRIFEG